MTIPQGVLLVGTGRRVEHHFIPALSCLGETYVIRGVHSRQRLNVERVAERWGIPPVFNLHDVDWDGIGLVAVSITTANVPSLLRRLRRVASQLVLFIDTPVFGRARDLWAFSLLRGFRRVVVAEDFVRFPLHDLVRDVVGGGALGRILRVRLVHSGYNHHAVALARSLLGMRYPHWIRARTSGPDPGLECRFPSGAAATLVDPYWKEGGHLEVVGEQGVLTDRPGLDHRRPVHLIEAYPINRPPGGFSVRVGDREHFAEPRGIASLPWDRLRDPSRFDLATIAGLVALLRDAADSAVPQTAYSAFDAVHDYLAPGLARRLGFLPDPFAVLGGRA